MPAYKLLVLTADAQLRADILATLAAKDAILCAASHQLALPNLRRAQSFKGLPYSLPPFSRKKSDLERSRREWRLWDAANDKGVAFHRKRRF